MKTESFSPYEFTLKYDEEESLDEIVKSSDEQLISLEEDIFQASDSNDADDYIKPYLSNDLTIESKLSKSFNYEYFDKFYIENETNNIDLLVKIPTKPPLKRYESFNISIKILNNKDLLCKNIIIHLNSDDFNINNRFLSMNPDDTFDLITLTKKHNNRSMNIILELYMDNILNYRRSLIYGIEKMNFGNKITSFKLVKPDKDFRHHSTTLFIELDDEGYCNFRLNYNGQLREYPKSRIVLNDVFTQRITTIIFNCFIKGEYQDPILFSDYQSELAEITDDLFSRELRKDIFLIKNNIKYLVISDEYMPINLPYPILFFPDPTYKNGISENGFFLSEVFTIIRSSIPTYNEIKINEVFTLSSDDLTGSTKEEQILNDFFESKSISTVSLEDLDVLKQALHDAKGDLFHFCCHGSVDNCIVFQKSGKWHEIKMNDLSLSKFKDGSFLVLNICNGNFTNYDVQIPRSMADKLLDRNAELVLTTEWPIYDNFAFFLGTSLYKSLLNKKSIAYTLHELKEKAITFDDKITALGYTLRGNPNLKINI